MRRAPVPRLSQALAACQARTSDQKGKKDEKDEKDEDA